MDFEIVEVLMCLTVVGDGRDSIRRNDHHCRAVLVNEYILHFCVLPSSFASC